MPIISVIVPIYKVEKYLDRCIKSIQNQTYKNLEIILVDDGSPDNCGVMCDEYAEKDDRIKVIHKANGGLSDARNIGIEASTGDYIVFVDSDDWLDLDMIEVLYNIGIKYKADIVECSFRNVYSDWIIEETKCTAEIVEGDSLKALEGMLDWKYFKPVAWNKLYKRSIIGGIRYPKGKIHEDEFTTYKYFYAAKKLVYLDVSKYNYDKSRTDSITGDKFKESNLYKCEALRERIDFFKEHKIVLLEEKINNVYCWVLLDSMYKCYKNKLKGPMVKNTLNLLNKDLNYFLNSSINDEYKQELKILSKGLKRFGIYKDTLEL
ncbi:MAG: glycosyltransferase [Herbinix sp.]|nr:glycosyltransferase [Herbinix sp.]